VVCFGCFRGRGVIENLAFTLNGTKRSSQSSPLLLFLPSFRQYTAKTAWSFETIRESTRLVRYLPCDTKRRLSNTSVNQKGRRPANTADGTELPNRVFPSRYVTGTRVHPGKNNFAVSGAAEGVFFLGYSVRSCRYISKPADKLSNLNKINRPNPLISAFNSDSQYLEFL